MPTGLSSLPAQREYHLADLVEGSVQAAPLGWTSREDALRDVCGVWNVVVRTGWGFAEVLDAALKRYGTNNESKASFLSDVAAQVHVTPKRLQNMVSIVRNPCALVAKEYGLELGHGDVLARLQEEEEAASWAAVAAEQSWTVSELRQAIMANEGEDIKSPPLILELDPNGLPDDISGAIVNFLRSNYADRFSEICANLATWLEGQ